MKFKNIATRTGLFSVVALMVAACQSDKKKLDRVNSEIDKIETEIAATYIHNEATDSASRNPMLKTLNTMIDADSPRIDAMYERNWELADSLNNIQIQRMAKKYPLRKFLSRNELKVIQAQLRRGCCYQSEKAAQNIIAGRGTLLDLYAVSFDLRLEPYEPFCIIDPFGTVRFYDEKRDVLRQKFDDEKWEILSGKKVHKEYQANEAEIQAFDRLIDVRDSIQSEIEAYYQPQITHRIDSLIEQKNNLCKQRDELALRINARSK